MIHILGNNISFLTNIFETSIVAKYKIINIAFFNLALLTTISPSSLTFTSTKAVSVNEVFLSAKVLSKAEINHSNLLGQQSKPQPLHKSQNSANYYLVADSDLAENDNDAEESSNKLLRFFSLTFFILFFVPLGIFYPLFLFYRKLLIHPDEPNYSFRQDYELKLTDKSSLIELGFEAKEKGDQDTNKATVSKLQIAFSPTASDLRLKLGQLASNNELHDIVELMRRTATVLITQDCWTHVNYASITLPLEEIKVEFDLVSYRERSKFTSKNLSLIDRNSEVAPSQSSNNYSYVVVTLILCTNHKEPLFDKIVTKKQLVGELLKLSKMRKDYLIKFELLWNPQEENKYIGNDQLLTEYSEMIRLF